MHAKQFVKEFAAYAELEQDLATLQVIDRALAEAGFRAKTKGKRMPDVTIKEGMLFLLAVLANVQPTRAADAVVELGHFRILQSREGRSALTMLARQLRRPVAEVLPMRLLDVLVALSGKLTASPDYGPWVELSVVRGGSAFLTLGKNMDDAGPDGGFGQVQFCGTLGTRIPKMLSESRTASPGLVRWVALNTQHISNDASEAAD